MKIEWEGRAYDFDSLGALMSQATQITAYMGCKSMSEWERLTVDPEDERFPRAVTAALWLMLAQDGQDVKLADLDPPYMRFFQALAAAVKAEAEAGQAAEEDPTRAAAGSGGTSPKPAAVSAG